MHIQVEQVLPGLPPPLGRLPLLGGAGTVYALPSGVAPAACRHLSGHVGGGRKESAREQA